ncbi:MAG: protein translocase subunit SecD [Candidatus Levybacteria bacterium]|nr:protein translocase subunit SecD [Candidatus Levybacteria bacterium]
MRKRPTFLFIFILFISLIAFLINSPKEIHLPEKILLPGTQTAISLPKKIQLVDTQSLLRFIRVERNLSFRKGLDLEGGTSITLRADMRSVPNDQRKNALESAKTVIERRVNFFGVSEPVVQTAAGNNDYRVIAEIPGVTDVNQAVSLIGTTAKLTFWEEGATGAAELAPPDQIPLNSQVFLGQNPKKTDLSGADLRQSTVTFDPNSGQPVVQLAFTGEGAKKFAAITKRNVGKRLGFSLDNIMVDAPVVQNPILDGNAIISGSFTTEQAKALQLQLNAGALPVSLSVLEQRAIGATLGSTSVQKSLIAGAIGFVVIVIFMIILYGRLGVIASLALIVYTLITLAFFRLIPVTLTLAGIAGFILSIGIAVDANILIFERMREELRKGKSDEQALALGFTRAWSSIRDSNIASLITSGILYYFGTGMVRGFALTLAIGVLVSMFSAILVTRTFLRMVYNTR